MEFVSLMGAARRLEVRRTAVAALASAGLARSSSSTVDGKPVFDASELDDLVRRFKPLRVPSPIRTVLVKLGPPDVDDYGRKIGYHVDYSAQEARNAARMYWRVAASDNTKGAAFVATVGGFPVVIAKISGIRRHVGGVVEFQLTDPPQQVLDIYENRFIQTRPGGAIEYLGPWDVRPSEEDIADAASADAAMDELGESVSLQQVEHELGLDNASHMATA